jgi:PAS domain S-box-containing protein
MPNEVITIEAASVFDALDVGVVLLDRDGNVAFWNNWIARATNLPPASVVGRRLVDVYPELQASRLSSVIDDSFQVGSSSILTHSLNNLLPLRGEAGEQLLHNIVVRPAAAGRVQYCLLQVNDVTVAVTRERVLRERQNARYHAIVDTAPDPIITISADRTIQWLNEAAQQIFGYGPSELLGQKMDVLLGENADVAVSLSNESFAGREKTSAIPVIGRRKDGSRASFEMSFADWQSDDRVFITTIWRDVTERMAAEAALRDSEARHRALLEALPQLVWTCGPDGGCDYFNPQWRDYTDGSPEEQLGWGWLNGIHEADRETVETAWRASLAKQVVFDVDARLRRADGTYRWFKMRSIPVHGVGGVLTRWFGTATEITDLIEARDSLRRSNEELEERVAERTREREIALAQLYESQKMETIGQLTGGVAHDFNNLLAVILGSLTLLRKVLPDDPRTARLLDGATQGAERGATLTKRLLAFARRQELKLEAVEIQKLIPDMLDFLRQSVGPGIAIEVDILPDVAPVRIDANQLELALMNLAVNARDAMPAGGTLTISCRNATKDRHSSPTMLPAGEYVRLSVADTGEGMNRETLARATEPFFTTKGVGKGTGLGLSMVHGLTAQSGGAMEISSQVGKGTVVTLWLSRARREDVQRASTPPAGPPVEGTGRKLSILLVDDDALVSMNTASMLMDLGHDVIEATSAAHALQLLQSDARFDAVITDYAMPNMHGLELATRISERAPDLPIIIASGYAELPTDAAIDFWRLGKPFTQEELADALDRAIDRTGPG